MSGDGRGCVFDAQLLDVLVGEGVRMDDDYFVEMMWMGLFRFDRWTVHPLVYSLSLILKIVWRGGDGGGDSGGYGEGEVEVVVDAIDDRCGLQRQHFGVGEDPCWSEGELPLWMMSSARCGEGGVEVWKRKKKLLLDDGSKAKKGKWKNRSSTGYGYGYGMEKEEEEEEKEKKEKGAKGAGAREGVAGVDVEVGVAAVDLE